MKELLIEGGWEELNKQGGSVWIGRSGGSSAVAISLGDVYRGNEASKTMDQVILERKKERKKKKKKKKKV